MKPNKFLNSLTLMVLVGTAFSTVTDVAFAAPPSTPSATDKMSFRGTVALECSVDEHTSSGTDVPYTVTSPDGGNGNIKDNGVLEPRVTKLEATDNITFDCNSNTASFSIALTTLTAPKNFTNATDIDLVSTVSGAPKGVDHKVGIWIKYPNPVCPLTFCQEQERQNVDTDSELDLTIINSSSSLPLDKNGDVKFELTSRFETINGAEELAAGLYQAKFLVTVTAK